VAWTKQQIQLFSYVFEDRKRAQLPRVEVTGPLMVVACALEAGNYCLRADFLANK